MSASRADIDLATRGELENMMALESLPFSSLTLVFGYRDDYTSILRLILRGLNCLKLVSSKKNQDLDIKAIIELPVNYEDSILFKNWSKYKRAAVGFSRDFAVDEIRNLYPAIEKCRNFCIENIIDRGESSDFIKAWKGILAKCATQNPSTTNRFRLVEAKDILAIAIRPFQILRDAKLIKVEELTDFKETKVNGRFEMSTYMFINDTENIIRFIEGSLKPAT